jgi:predicted AlkP superfamily pyrophosphatase or phosphodiesterase
VKASSWAVDATVEVMRAPAPDLLLTYLPHLDYELQRTGPNSEGAARSFAEAKALLGKLLAAARERGYKVIVFGDYAIVPVSRPVHPNRALLDAGLMNVRNIKGMTYPDLFTSRAFAVVDHQIAHVILKDAGDAAEATDVLKKLPGVARVLDKNGKQEVGIDHSRAGDLVIVAEPDSWFAYPWWRDRKQAPDYATHVDIHSKPGYDPCELFWGRWPFSVSTDATKVRGSHGLIGIKPCATWATNLDLGAEPESIIDLSRALKSLLDNGGRA